MNANASQLFFVVLLIGRKSGQSFLSQSCGIESEKPITFGHSNENRRMPLNKNLLVHFYNMTFSSISACSRISI